MFPSLPLLLLSSLLLFGCSIPKPLVERIKEKGELLVVTRVSPPTYADGREGPRGLEHELVRRLAEELGVEARFLFPKQFDQILPTVMRGDAHFAAAGLTVTEGRKKKLRFTTGYQEITQQLIYRTGNKRPKKITDTLDGTLEIVADSSHEEELVRLKDRFPKLQWTAQQSMTQEELLFLVKEQVIDYTIADSNEVAMFRLFHPELKVAFDLTEPQPLAWAFPHAEDNSLFDAAQAFLINLKKSGTMNQLIERYYGHSNVLNFVDTRTFRRHIHNRLPPLIPHFKYAAEETGTDWQLLAAIGYQESHWDTKAVSPTGVKGIMMLTRDTARQLGIKSRTDPKESILGGARYLRIVEKKIPERIPEPDRMWMSLAGYNIGFGHLEDARILTQRKGGDPDKWTDVKRHLPLLSQESYYKTLKYGYARGQEPVTYVDNIRGYYGLLKWENNQQELEPTVSAPALSTTPGAL